MRIKALIQSAAYLKPEVFLQSIPHVWIKALMQRVVYLKPEVFIKVLVQSVAYLRTEVIHAKRSSHVD